MEQRHQLLALLKTACADGARQAIACEQLSLSVRTIQRWKKHQNGDKRIGQGRVPHNKFSDRDNEVLLAVLNSPAYSDYPPSQIVPRLADEGRYLASESTLYRLLAKENQCRHRGASRVKRNNKPKAVCATKPNQLYSWDITYLPSAVRGLYFFLYVFIDIFSRKIVGWQVHHVQSSELAAACLKDICYREGIERDQVVLHSDNGTPMKGVSMLSMMQSLGIVPSFSRPSVSDDNPFIESFFRTTKYAPTYPDYFQDINAAREYFEQFIHWYNEQHRHSGIKFVTPAQRHRGEDDLILQKRKAVYEKAKAKFPQRWNGRATRNWSWVKSVSLNPDKKNLQKIALAEVV